MKTCKNCGFTNPNVNTSCASCGEPLPISPGYSRENAQGYVPMQNGGFGRYTSADHATAYTTVAAPIRYRSCGLILWAILTMLISTIPGVVALVFAVEINSSYSFSEQIRKISLARGWCIAGTVLGLLGFLLLLSYNR